MNESETEATILEVTSTTCSAFLGALGSSD